MIGAGHGTVDGLDLPALERFFTDQVPGFCGGLTAEPVSGGRSNLTYRLTDGTGRWILRRPPLGGLTPPSGRAPSFDPTPMKYVPAAVPVKLVIPSAPAIGEPEQLVDKAFDRLTALGRAAAGRFNERPQPLRGPGSRPARRVRADDLLRGSAPEVLRAGLLGERARDMSSSRCPGSSRLSVSASVRRVRQPVALPSTPSRSSSSSSRSLRGDRASSRPLNFTRPASPRPRRHKSYRRGSAYRVPSSCRSRRRGPARPRPPGA